MQVELRDYVWLTHPKVLDLTVGKLGLSNVVCEVIDKQPNCSQGAVDFTLLGTRFINLSTAFSIAAGAANIPNYADATPSQRRYKNSSSPQGSNPVATRPDQLRG